MKSAFGIPLYHIEEKYKLEFNNRLVAGNLRKCYLISIMGAFFLFPMLYLDWLRYNNGDCSDFSMFLIFITHLVFLLFFPLAFYITYFRKTIFQTNLETKKKLIFLTLSVLTCSILPMGMLSIPGGGTILVFGIFIMLINFVVTVDHLWRLIINCLCVFLMISAIVVFKGNDVIYATVRTLECVGISVPAFAFATFHYNTKVKEFTNSKLLFLEREQSEKLLLNILPSQTAHELKETGKATPHFHEMATVLFTDFKDFSSETAFIDPNILLNTLNDYFIAFDNICKKYNLEKIKTIGDAYMAVSGIPFYNENHAVNACFVALEMQSFVNDYNYKSLKSNNLFFEMRLGLHSGALVSGVVGSEKFSFDVWGNTVNTAARMEAQSEVGRVNISASTFQFVKNHFSCEYRGKKEIKNLGEVDMYFLNQIAK